MWLKSLDSSQKRSEFVKLARESSYGRLNSATVTAWAIICKYKKAVLSQRWPRNAPIWVPENFQDSLTTPTATIPNIYHGLLYRSTLWMFLQNLKFTVLPVPEIIGGTQKFGQSLWIRPRYIFAQCTVPNFRKQSFIIVGSSFFITWAGGEQARHRLYSSSDNGGMVRGCRVWPRPASVTAYVFSYCIPLDSALLQWQMSQLARRETMLVCRRRQVNQIMLLSGVFNTWYTAR